MLRSHFARVALHALASVSLGSSEVEPSSTTGASQWCQPRYCQSRTSSLALPRWKTIRWLHFAWVVDDAKCIVVTRVCVYLCVCPRPHAYTLLSGPGCNLGSGRGCPLVVHYWADLQSVNGLRCYGNTRTARPTARTMHADTGEDSPHQR